MDLPVLVDVSAEPNQHNHCYHPSGPQQDLQEERSLLWAVHLVLQDDTADNMKDRSF